MNAKSLSRPHSYGDFLLRSFLRGWVSSARLLENLPSWLSIPIKHLSSDMLLGGDGWCFVRVGLNFMSVDQMIEEFHLVLLELTLRAGFRVAPAQAIRVRTANSLSCSLLSLPKTRTSSMRQMTPSSPERIFDIGFLICRKASCWRIVSKWCDERSEEARFLG